MGVVHGFHGLNLQGLLSGLLVVLILPIYYFLLSKPLPEIVYRVLILLTCVVLMLESVFAFGYRYLGIGMNDDHLWSGDVLVHCCRWHLCFASVVFRCQIVPGTRI